MVKQNKRVKESTEPNCGWHLADNIVITLNMHLHGTAFHHILPI